jgi:hypothetical protein
LEHRWELHGTGSWLMRLASFSRLITFGERGNGLSDRGGGTASMDEWVEDLHAVMNAAGRNVPCWRAILKAVR